MLSMFVSFGINFMLWRYFPHIKYFDCAPFTENAKVR